MGPLDKWQFTFQQLNKETKLQIFFFLIVLPHLCNVSITKMPIV